MNRVLNPSKYLKGVVDEGKTFYIGFGVRSLTELGKSHPGLFDLINGHTTTLIVTGKKSSLRENTKGKYVRKQPESKESIWKHIHYYSKRFEKEIDYNREFHIWEKELLHQYHLALEKAETPQKEVILHFPAFKMKDDPALYMKAGAAMNMAIALGAYFMIYDNVFEPIVPVTKIEHKKMLSSGNLTVAQKLELVDKEFVDHDREGSFHGNSYRFAMLKEMEPSDVTIGLGGFDEYLMFEYTKDDLVIFENLKTGNATFIFRHSLFKTGVELNKQNAKANPAFLKRIVHNNIEGWNKQFSAFFKR
ncbi:hypothetical protein PQ469_24305 [Mucilaginibacter sp. KACC 22773]|uniref:hypothetical protein n=1 Tax=Mucilaginibacter sp. KACC 22773 TaxID=3025671 RepID=UPI00236589CD|nr:hypothetical protein [Mucilaginibacter sp. KACC 22773]WDF77010.1 hypothetical protein PQ469_24305 [Mucilaginibacter sp. KACC 22773]